VVRLTAGPTLQLSANIPYINTPDVNTQWYSFSNTVRETDDKKHATDVECYAAHNDERKEARIWLGI
jgi:hypothetical protein